MSSIDRSLTPTHQQTGTTDTGLRYVIRLSAAHKPNCNELVIIRRLAKAEELPAVLRYLDLAVELGRSASTPNLGGLFAQLSSSKIYCCDP